MRRFKKAWLIMFFVILIPMAVYAADDNSSKDTKIFSLDNCLKLGFQNNTQLLLAKSNIQMYQKEVQRAFGSYLPSLTYQFDNYTLSDTNPYTYPTNPYNVYDGQVSVSQPLYTGGKISFGYKNAKLNLQSAFEDKRKAEQELVYQIKEAFYDMWLKQQNLVTADISQNTMGKHYQLVNRMYQVGNANKLELYQAQGQWEEQKVAAITARNQVDQARLTLATLIGVNKFLEFSVEYDLTKFNFNDVNKNLIQVTAQQAFEDRPESRKVKINIEIAENNIKIAEANLSPTIGLSGNYKTQSQDLTANGEKSWGLTLSFSGTVFDGFSAQAGIGSAKQSLISAQLQEKLQQDQIFTDVAQSLQSLKQSRDLIHSTQMNVDFMKERVHLTELQYNNGKATTSDFIDAQSALDKAYNDYYGQIMSYLTALATLDYSIGKDAAVGEGQ
jgi:outer membrane protein TolC